MSIRIGSKNQYDTRVTVFRPEIKTTTSGKTIVSASISSSKKLPSSGDEAKYRNSNWFATFVGDAAEKAKSLVEKDRIELTLAEVENVYVKEKDRSYLSVTIYDFKRAENAGTSEDSSAPASTGGAGDGFMNIPDGIDESLPFN